MKSINLLIINEFGIIHLEVDTYVINEISGQKWLIFNFWMINY